MKLAPFKVLSDNEIAQIHDATIDILENTGVKIGSLKMLDALEERGVKVDRHNMIARFTKQQVESALKEIPDSFDVYDREGQKAFTLGIGRPKIAAGHNAIFWVDSETGQTRNSKVSDVEFLARICQDLAAIDMIGIPVMPQDVLNPKASLLYGVKAVIENSSKPIFFSTDREEVNRSIIEMLKAAFKGDLKTQVYGITQLSPTSPLYWEESVLDAIMDTVETGVPLAILPEPNAGISAPYTLAGLVTVNNAECLSGLVMIQMLKPGYKCLYANSWTTTDMRNGAALVGSTETSICRIAGAQLAKFYGIPCHTTAPNSDNHAHDEQNAWEKTFSTFCAVGAGNDLIVNCGMFATGLTCSHEQLLMDEEISAMALRIHEGMNVNTDTIAADLIKEIGPMGSYMMAEHTLEWLYSEEYLPTRLSVRIPRASWEAAGSKDTYQIAREKVAASKDLIGCPLDAERKAVLDKIVASF